MLNIWNSLHIEQPYFLLALLIIPLVYFWKSRSKGHVVHFRMPFDKFPDGTRSWRHGLIWLLPMLRVVLFVSAIIALSRPQLTLTEESVRAEGIDIMMAMDVSSSMLSRDFDPNRLTVSKAVATEFVDKRPYDRIGLVAFAAESYTQSPLTTDHDILKTFIDGLQCGYLENGTAIGMGLASGVNRLKNSLSESKVIILLTDGVNNAGYIAPETAMELAIEYGVRVYTIGVGTEGMALTPSARTRDGGYSYAMRRVEIDEELLREIANKTGGSYFRATSTETLKRIYEEIDQLEKTEMEITVFKRYKDLFSYFIFISLIAALLEFMLKHFILKLWP